MDIPVIDVRSPKEFHRGHIPGAFNIPLFDNEERAIVGTTYKQVGREPALKIGYGIAGVKSDDIVKRISEIAPGREVLVYCWRGGMRSAGVASLLDKNGFNVSVLQKGYKAYRNFLMERFSKPAKIILLGGMTGSGKTEILQELGKHGEQVIDLEELARHKGSAFGALGQQPQPTTEQFQNDIFTKWLMMDLQKPIWLEDESMTIGTVNLPIPLYRQMREAHVINIEIERKIRVGRLVLEYARFDKETLKYIFYRIGERLGSQNVQRAVAAIDKEDFYTAAEISLVYYDVAYLHGIDKRKKESVTGLKLNSGNPAENSVKVLERAHEVYSSLYLSPEVKVLSGVST